MMDTPAECGNLNENKLSALIQVVKNKFAADKGWPCPFCVFVCCSKIQCRFHVKKNHPDLFYIDDDALAKYSQSDSNLPIKDTAFNDRDIISLSIENSNRLDRKDFSHKATSSFSEEAGVHGLHKCLHCPPKLGHKLFKGLRGLKSHHSHKHKDIEFTLPNVGFDNCSISGVEFDERSLDFSVDGAQSLNLQTYLLSKGVEQHDVKDGGAKFDCISCNRSFDSYRGLQIHRSHHQGLTDKINVKVFERKHKGFDKEFFFPEQVEQYDSVPNDLEEFLQMNNVDLCGGLNDATNHQENSQASTQSDTNNTTCSVCGFVAKSKGGLKLHTKVHLRPDRQDYFLFKDNNVLTLIELIAFYRRNNRLLHQIPKGARAAAADKLSKLIDFCILKNDLVSWRSLFTFSYTSLCMPEKDNKTSLTSAVKKNIFNVQQIGQPHKIIQQPRTQSKDSFAKRIEQKVAEGDIKNAMRLLTSEDSLAPETEETFNSLLSKHPKPSRINQLPDPPNNINHIVVDEKAVLKAINSYKKGSAAGLDGIKPQFLKDMLSKRCGESATRLLKSITNLMNFMLAGKLCSDICEYMFGAILIALKKKDGGIRPIAIGNTFPRMCAKLACNEVSNKMANYLCPKQVGFSIRGGCEAAVHTARKFISSVLSPRKVMLKVDMKNAFNSVFSYNFV